MVKTVISSRAMKNLTVTLCLENKKKWSGKSLQKVLNSVHKKVYCINPEIRIGCDGGKETELASQY